jgi:protein SCO1/2
MRAPTRIMAWLLAAIAVAAGPARSEEAPGTTLSKVGFDQNLDAPLPLDLNFRDESGRAVALGDYFGSKPVIVTLVYFRCPMLCGEELKGLARSLKPLSMAVGKDFDVITVSIDPKDTPESAREKKAKILEYYGREGSEAGWHFLTGDEPAIAALARTVGFRYVYNAESEQYVHAAGLAIATPQGRLARDFYGIDFPPKDLQFGLIEASRGKIGSPIARLLLFCYHSDPTTGKYTLAIVNILRVVGTATALGLAAYVVAMIRRDRRPLPATKPMAS